MTPSAEVKFLRSKSPSNESGKVTFLAEVNLLRSILPPILANDKSSSSIEFKLLRYNPPFISTCFKFNPSTEVKPLTLRSPPIDCGNLSPLAEVKPLRSRFFLLHLVNLILQLKLNH